MAIDFESDEIDKIYNRLENIERMDETQIRNVLRRDREGNLIRKETSGIRELAKWLYEPNKIEEDINKAKTLKGFDEIDLEVLDESKMEASKGVTSRKDDLKDLFNEKQTDFFIDRINKLTTQSAVENIIEKSEELPPTQERQVTREGEDKIRELDRGGIRSLLSSFDNDDDLIKSQPLKVLKVEVSDSLARQLRSGEIKASEVKM